MTDATSPPPPLPIHTHSPPSRLHMPIVRGPLSRPAQQRQRRPSAARRCVSHDAAPVPLAAHAPHPRPQNMRAYLGYVSTPVLPAVHHQALYITHARGPRARPRNVASRPSGRRRTRRRQRPRRHDPTSRDAWGTCAWQRTLRWRPGEARDPARGAGPDRTAPGCVPAVALATPAPPPFAAPVPLAVARAVAIAGEKRAATSG